MPLKWVPRGNTYRSTFFVEISKNDVGPVTSWGVVETPLKKCYWEGQYLFYGGGTDHKRYTP